MSDTSPLLLTASEWITIAAIIAGPLLAVWVTRFHDHRTRVREQRLSVFRSLLKTRQTRLDPEHVGALNLIEIEFYGHEAVVTAYSNYINHLSSAIPNESQQDRYFRDRHDLFMALLHAVGKQLGYKFDKLDLDRRGYSPVAWMDDQDRMRKNAALLTELLEGRRALPTFHLQMNQGAFPPPPPPEA